MSKEMVPGDDILSSGGWALRHLHDWTHAKEKQANVQHSLSSNKGHYIIQVQMFFMIIA